LENFNPNDSINEHDYYEDQSKKDFEFLYSLKNKLAEIKMLSQETF